MIAKYDRPATFFYVDPPYYEVKGCYRLEMTPEEHAGLRDALVGVKGKFLLSINNTAEIRRLYAGCEIRTVRTAYSLNDREWQEGIGELLVANFPLPKRLPRRRAKGRPTGGKAA